MTLVDALTHQIMLCAAAALAATYFFRWVAVGEYLRDLIVEASCELQSIWRGPAPNRAHLQSIIKYRLTWPIAALAFAGTLLAVFVLQRFARSPPHSLDRSPLPRHTCAD